MSARSYSLTLALFTALFFLAGVITSLNEILNPFFKNQFELSFAAAALTQFSFYLAFLVLGIPCGWLIGRYGYKRVALGGLAVLLLGVLLFLPASLAGWFPLFLAALFVVACGVATLMILSNPYVALMGKAASASSRLNLANGFHSVGTVAGPAFGAALITARAPRLGVESVQLPYLLLAALVSGFLLLVWRMQIPEAGEEGQRENHGEGDRPSLWDYPHFLLGITAIFLYVGAEVGIGSIMVKYLSQPDTGNLSEAEAGVYLSLYWGGAMAGRFLGTWLLQYIPAQRALAFNAVLATLMAGISMLSSGPLAMFTLVSLGLCHSIMFANIFALATAGLGRHTPKASGILLSAAVGGAVLPFLQGLLADALGLQLSLLLPLGAYLYILFFGTKGSQWRRAEA